MGLLDWLKFWKRKQIEDKYALTKEEIEEQIKQAWWDLYVSNLPNPVVIDTQNDKNTLELFKKGVPKGFSIDPETWITYFNREDIPLSSAKQEGKDYCRSIGHHETMHFTVCPASKRMSVRLADAALKGFTENRNNNQKYAAMAHLVTNIFGDWGDDTLIGVEKYGREDFTQLTRKRMRTSIDHVACQTKEFSPLWKVLVGTYEKLFNEDFLSKYTTLNYTEKHIVDECVNVMGDNFRDNSLWPEKVRRLARILEDVIKESDPKQGRGDRLSLPKDVEKQLGKKSMQSPMQSFDQNQGQDDQGQGQKGGEREQRIYGGEKEEKVYGEQKEDKETSVDGEVLEEVYNLNKDNPGQFAGTLGALAPVQADEALRLMYRMRAREYLIKIAEKKEHGSYATPSSYTRWDVGDPILGRGGLEIVPSIMSTGIAIPGTTTVKRLRQVNDLPGKVEQIADLAILIDSSGSMDWNPGAPDEESRGAFDKAILTGEAASQYAIDHGAKVAIINFSGEDQRSRKRQVVYCDFTNNLGTIEKILTTYYNDGTIWPVDEFSKLMKKNKTRVVTLAISDFALSNNEEAMDTIKRYTNERDHFYMFDIGGGNRLYELNEWPGITRIPVRQMSDLKDVVIGKLKKEYKK